MIFFLFSYWSAQMCAGCRRVIDSENINIQRSPGSPPSFPNWRHNSWVRQLHAFCQVCIPLPPAEIFLTHQGGLGCAEFWRYYSSGWQSYSYSVTKLCKLCKHSNKFISTITIRKSSFKKNSTTHCKGGGGRSSRRIIMCLTATFSNNASNWGGKGGCLGFFVYLCSLSQSHAGNLRTFGLTKRKQEENHVLNNA